MNPVGRSRLESTHSRKSRQTINPTSSKEGYIGLLAHRVVCLQGYGKQLT